MSPRIAPLPNARKGQKPPVKKMPYKGGDWRVVFIRAMGGKPTPATMKFLTSWWHQEGGDLTNNAHFNWLNTTHGDNYPKINDVGVRSYPDFQTGIKNLVEVFSYYPHLSAGIRGGKVDLSNPGVQQDLNKWLSGNAVPGVTPYISKIASGVPGAKVTLTGPVRASQPSRRSQTIPGLPAVSGGVAMPVIGNELQPEQIGLPQAGKPSGFPTEDLREPLGLPPFKVTTYSSGGLPPLKVAHPANEPPDAQAENVIQIARHYLGTPYVFGAAGPKNFDCSGLVQFVYKQVGINLPRTTWEQMKVGKRVSPSALRPGDILFFHKGGHEMMYIGNGRAIEAPRTGDVVKIIPLKNYDPIYMARRVL